MKIFSTFKERTLHAAGCGVDLLCVVLIQAVLGQESRVAQALKDAVHETLEKQGKSLSSQYHSDKINQTKPLECQDNNYYSGTLL